jgi:hypothetical protein
MGVDFPLDKKALKKSPPINTLIKTLGRAWAGDSRKGSSDAILAASSANLGLSESRKNSIATPFMQYRWPVGSGPSFRCKLLRGCWNRICIGSGVGWNWIELRLY